MKPFAARAACAVLFLMVMSGPALAGAAPGANGVPEHSPGPARLLASPAAPGSAEPNLASGADGRVWLSWIEPVSGRRGARGAAAPARGERHRLRCAALSGGRWSPASTIVEGDSLFANGADIPSLAPLPDGRLVAHWPWSNGPDSDGYTVRLAVSRDGGTSWSRPVRAHEDVSSAEHGFVSMIPEAGGVHVVWLDGRKGAGKPEGTAETELRSAWLDATGSVVEERALDPRVCDCCPTAAVAVPGGMLVAYRDRDATEIRDISLVRLAHGRWSEPYPLHADGWTIAGCPVNGPALAASGSHVAASWYSGASETPCVRAAFSDDGGAHFGAPVLVDGDAPLGRVQVTALDDGSAIVLWVGSNSAPSQTQGEGRIFARRVSASGAPGRPVTIAHTPWARSGGRPRMARAGDTLVFAWTEVAPARAPAARPVPKRIRVATVPLSAFGADARK